MPAGSETTLPHTWRPLGVRVAGGVAAVGLLVLCIGAWVAVGDDVRARFDSVQRGTMVGFGLLTVAVWFALVRARLSARPEGVAVVNGYRRRNLEWAQIVALRLRRGAPWAEMDLSDGTTIPVMAIQGSDGDRAKQAVRAFRRALAEQTSVERND